MRTVFELRASGLPRFLRALALALTGALVLAGCQTAKPALPSGSLAYEVIPPQDLAKPAVLYALEPGDVISVSVFQEKDLSVEKVTLDNFGDIQMPLIGQVKASGRTAPQLANELAALFGSRYLRDPRVTVSLLERSKQTVAVEGQVNQPGVYEIDRNYTLLSALALARSTTRTAKLDEVAVFRTINGKRTGALFNLADIRAGRASDPEILGGDIVVVGFSSIKGAWRDILTAAPLFNVFTQF